MPTLDQCVVLLVVRKKHPSLFLQSIFIMIIYQSSWTRISGLGGNIFSDKCLFDHVNNGHWINPQDPAIHNVYGQLHPSKHNTSTQCWYTVGPVSQTVAQHCINIVLILRVGCGVQGYVLIPCIPACPPRWIIRSGCGSKVRGTGFKSRLGLCIYSAPNCSKHGVCSVVYGTLHLKQPLNLKGPLGMRHFQCCQFWKFNLYELYSLLIWTKNTKKSKNSFKAPKKSEIVIFPGRILSCKQKQSAIYSTSHHIFPRLGRGDQSNRR